MRIGLIADTHIPDVAKALPPEVFQAFGGVDLILHAGDIYIASVLDELERIAPVLAAKGDDDCGNIEEDGRVEDKHILELEGQTLWLVHERPWISGRYAPEVIVFGHEHRVTVQRHGGVLFVNPGSPTFQNYRRGLGTVGILSINSGDAEVQIVQL